MMKDHPRICFVKFYRYSPVIEYLLKNSYNTESVEYNDNRISLFAGQRGKCYVTGEILKIIVHSTNFGTILYKIAYDKKRQKNNLIYCIIKAYDNVGIVSVGTCSYEEIELWREL